LEDAELSAFSRAFLLADAVLYDQISGKWTLVGISGSCRVAGFPSLCPKFSVFSAVSNIGGFLVGTFQVLDPDMQLVGEAETPVSFARRCDSPDFIAIFSGLILKKAGAYTVQFLLNNEVVSTTRLLVEESIPNTSGG
jgi:hypothetical protein